MYQALYRVWRPKTFSDMVGQEAIVRTLRHQVTTGRIAHAYLFCGSRGTGKTSAARILTRAINCLNPQNGDPCGECASCQMIESGTSFDVYEMDAASNSRVEEIRELLEKVDCRYTLAVEAAKRAREIIAGSLPLIDTKETKPLSIAIEEINRRLITYSRNEEAEDDEI